MPTQRRKKSNLFIENINCSENFAKKNKSFCGQQALTILQKTKRSQVENSVSYTMRRQTWRSQYGIAWPTGGPILPCVINLLRYIFI
jgi:hypothetical protein